MYTRHLVSLFLAGAAAIGCSDDPATTTCGPGTSLQDGACVVTDPTTCGDGTTLQDGTCVAAPPTTCGPGTALQNDVCVVDTSAPGPVTGLAATANGGDIDLAWTAGDGATGTLVVRLDSGAADAPAPHTPYTVGQTLPGGATGVAVGSGTTASVPFTTPGRYAYMAWSTNASGNYGFGREVSLVAGDTAQHATLAIDVAAATATVTTQPAGFQLSTANVVFDEAAGTVAFDLTATNQTAGHWFNTKAVVTSLSGGTLDNPTGELDGKPFVSLALAAQLPDVDAGHTVELGGVAATDTITVQLDIVESSFGLAAANAVDLDGGGSLALDLPALFGNVRETGVVSSSLFSPSGRYAYGTNRWSTTLVRIDTSNGDVTTSAILPGSGYGSCLRRGADGFGYAAFTQGPRHFLNGNHTLVVAKIDLATMTTVATTSVTTEDEGRLRFCGGRGDQLAIPFGQRVYLVDLATMAFVDLDTATVGTIDPIDTSTFDEDLVGLVYAPSGDVLYATARSVREILAIDMATHAVTTYVTAAGPVRGLAVDAAGALWWGQSDGLFTYDGTTVTKIPNYTADIHTIVRIGATDALVAGAFGTEVVDLADGTVSKHSAAVVSERSMHHVAVFETP